MHTGPSLAQLAYPGLVDVSGRELEIPADPPEPTPERIAERLGPFAPPEDFDHGEEFTEPTPRSIHPKTREGSYMARKHATTRGILTVGIVLIAAWLTPPVTALSAYVLPLRYMHWVGIAVTAYGYLRMLTMVPSGPPFNYLKNGRPVVGRVVNAGFLRIVTGNVDGIAQTADHVYVVAEFDEPGHGERRVEVFYNDNDLPHLTGREAYSVPLQPGEYITLVQPKGFLVEAMQPYGFLGLDPDREHILKNGRPWRGTPLRTLASVGGVATFVIAGLCAFGHLIGYSDFVDGNDPAIMWPTGILVGVGVLVGLAGRVVYVRGLEGPAWRHTLSGGTLTTALAAAGAGVMTSFLTVIPFNHFFDASDSRYEPFRVVNLWEETTNFLIRDYEIEYRLVGGDVCKSPVSFPVIQSFPSEGFGLREIGDGALGAAYVRRLIPFLIVELVPDADGVLPEFATPGSVAEVPDGEGGTRFLAAGFIGDPDVFTPELVSAIPDAAIRDALERIAATGDYTIIEKIYAPRAIPRGGDGGRAA